MILYRIRLDHFRLTRNNFCCGKTQQLSTVKKRRAWSVEFGLVSQGLGCKKLFWWLPALWFHTIWPTGIWSTEIWPTGIWSTDIWPTGIWSTGIRPTGILLTYNWVTEFEWHKFGWQTFGWQTFGWQTFGCQTFGHIHLVTDIRSLTFGHRHLVIDIWS